MNRDPRLRRLRCAIGIWFVVFAAMCIPFRRSTVSAMPGNLWTRGGDWSWGSAVSSQEVLPFRRTGHGLILPFLVVDRGQGHSDWSAKVEPRALAAYAVIACMAAGLSFIVLARPGKPGA